MAQELGVKFFRVSSDKQDERNQVAIVDKHFEAHGYIEAREPFWLHDVSASKGEHEPELDEILTDITNGKYAVVVMANSARIDRRDPDQQKFWALQVRMKGGRLESATEPEFGKSTISGRVVTLLAQQANYDYTKTLSANVLNSFNRIKADNGVTGKPPYGYATIGEKYSKRLIQVEAEAAVLREARDRYLGRGRDAETVDAICDDFNARGIPGPGYAMDPKTRRKADPPRRTPWHAKTVAGLLRSESTAGRRRQGNMTHTYDGIFTWQEHLDLVERLDSRAHRKGITPGNTALLTSLLKCGKCGRPMNSIIIGGPNSRRRAYYCRSGKDGCKMAFTMTDADEQAMTRFMETMGHGRYRKWEARHAPNHQDEIDQLRQDRNGLDDEADDYLARVAELTREIKRLVKQDEDNPPTVMVPVDQGCTIAERFMRLGSVERRQDMLDAGVTFIASKDDAGTYTLDIDLSSDKAQAYRSALRLKSS